MSAAVACWCGSCLFWRSFRSSFSCGYLCFFLSFVLSFCLHFFSTFLVLFFVCPWSVSEVWVMGDVPFLFRSNSSVQTWLCRGLMGSSLLLLLLLLLLSTRSGFFFFFPVFGGFLHTRIVWVFYGD